MKPVKGTASATVDVLVTPAPAPERARELSTLKALDRVQHARRSRVRETGRRVRARMRKPAAARAGSASRSRFRAEYQH
jgi:hypothetical protein